MLSIEVRMADPIAVPRAVEKALMASISASVSVVGYPEVERAGVTVCFYEPGFMHQKVVLVDAPLPRRPEEDS